MTQRTVRLGSAIRRARGTMTQTDLAQALGLDQPKISKWERDKDRPSLEDIQAIEDATGARRGFILISAGCVEEVLTVEDALAVSPISDGDRELVLAAYEHALRRPRG